MTAYYNEIDPYAAQWLRNLISAGHIAPGDVDERSIVDVRPDDLRNYTQCHFFAGIGGWSVALRLSGWDDARPVWTGSCPCQPFSAAGAGKAADDSRHLWPAWFPLIAECRPPTVFGEQVEAAIGWGWLDAVFADLEGQGYACGAAVLPACGVGAPHIRQRLWFVGSILGNAAHNGFKRGNLGDQTNAQCPPFGGRAKWRQGSGRDDATNDGPHSLLAHPNGRHPSPEGLQRGGEHGQWAQDGGPHRVGNAERPRLQEQRGLGSLPPSEGGTDARKAAERAGASVGELADTASERREGWPDARQQQRAEAGRFLSTGPSTSRSFWRDCDWLPCTDGKARPVEPGSFPLASGIFKRASKLRAYGNAIVPQVAAEFIKAMIQCTAPS